MEFVLSQDSGAAPVESRAAPMKPGESPVNKASRGSKGLVWLKWLGQPPVALFGFESGLQVCALYEGLLGPNLIF